MNSAFLINSAPFVTKQQAFYIIDNVIYNHRTSLDIMTQRRYSYPDEIMIHTPDILKLSDYKYVEQQKQYMHSSVYRHLGLNYTKIYYVDNLEDIDFNMYGSISWCAYGNDKYAARTKICTSHIYKAVYNFVKLTHPKAQDIFCVNSISMIHIKQSKSTMAKKALGGAYIDYV